MRAKTGHPLVLLGLCVGCGAPPLGEGEQATALSSAPREPVVVSFGGYDSCARGDTPRGTERWARAERLSQRLQRASPRWLRGCFDGGGTLRWTSSSAPTRVEGTRPEALAPVIRAVHELAGGRPVYVHGHSYGAWVAMQLAYALPPTTDLQMLVTVDPISPAHCTPSHYLAALASPLTAPWSLAGCQRAPTDFPSWARQRILARLPDGGWRHYYQRRFIPLRSSAFDAPGAPHRSYDVGPFLTHLGGAHPSWNAHVGADELSVVWYTFEASIAHALGLD